MPQNNNLQRANPVHKSYKHIAVIFVILAFLLIIGVTYLALSNVTISLTPSDSKLAHSFNLTVSENPASNTSTSAIISGNIITKTSQASSQFFVDSDKEIEALAEGEVLLYNDQATKQTLVATTRLLTSDNILFRLKNQVIIPAGSTMRAKVQADKKGAGGNIAPTNFTIPGLNENLQKLVYAKSDSSMLGGIKKIGILTESDIERAEMEFEEKYSKEIIDELTNNLDDKRFILIGTKISPGNIKLDKELGDEVDSFTLSGDISVTAVFADRDNILNIAKKEIKESQGPKGEFVNIDPSSLKYKLTNIDTDKNEAEVDISIEGLMTFDPNKDIFDKNLLVGFTEEDLKLYFSQFESVKDVSVEFSPFWVKKVPILKDHIIIQVQ
ncbi:MAG: hypothetical protein ABIJ91_01970 [Candidatus Kuenenbacteria bacterium]